MSPPRTGSSNAWAAIAAPAGGQLLHHDPDPLRRDWALVLVESRDAAKRGFSLELGRSANLSYHFSENLRVRVTGHSSRLLELEWKLE